MKRLLYIIFLTLFSSCLTNDRPDNCEGKILDLVVDSHRVSNNKIVNYAKTNDFITITDTNQLLRFAKPNEISYYFQPSKLDSTKRMFTLKAKEGIIKTANYQWDILLRQDNDEKGESYLFWLKSYDNNRNQVGHLDFAQWTEEGHYSSGRIDCDTTLHMILKNEHRIFKVNDEGKNILIETIRNK